MEEPDWSFSWLAFTIRTCCSNMRDCSISLTMASVGLTLLPSSACVVTDVFTGPEAKSAPDGLSCARYKPSSRRVNGVLLASRSKS